MRRRGDAARQGFGNTPRLLAATLRLSAADARTRTEQAAMVGPRRTMTAQVLAPRPPSTQPRWRRVRSVPGNYE